MCNFKPTSTGLCVMMDTKEIKDLRQLLATDSNGRLKLDLSSRGLTCIPAAVSLLSGVEVLDMSHNPIESYPEDLHKLKQLKELHLQNCKLTEFGPGLAELPSLEELDLSRNPIKTLPQDLSNLKHLKKLSLKKCRLTEVGSALTELTSLEDLDLSRNPIKTLPQDLSNLKHLKKLGLHGCQLTEVGSALTELTSLEELLLSWNPIKTLPQDLSNLKHLKKLSMDKCQITEVGSPLTELTSLEELGLSLNPINTLPQDLSNLKHLKKLVLCQCQLREVGSALTELTSLEELHLSGNRIKTLPQDLSNLKHLKKLGLYQCQLREVGSALTELTSLEELNLSWNPIKTLPQDLSNLKHLKKLDLCECQLREVGSALTELTSLEELHLSGNRIKTLPQDLSNLKHLKKLFLQKCQLTEVGSALTELTSLEELDLSLNLIKTLPQDLSNLKHLKKLGLQECQLTEVGSALTELTSLEEVNLSWNPIKTLPQDLSNLKHLKKLSLKKCQLTEVGSALTELTSLEDLDLSWNPIKTLPKFLSNLKHLKKLSLKKCRLTEVGSALTELTSLEDLDLSRNPIKTLPQDLSNLKHLKKLYLCQCQVREVGSALTELTSLEELNLSKNPIKTLPENFLGSKHLDLLYLDRCGLIEFPPVLCAMTSLRVLHCAHNWLKELPLSIRNLKALEELELKDNPLQVPPVEICEQGVEAVFSYLAEIRLARATHQKVVLLGCSEAGKTSLARTLVSGKPSCVPKEERTIVLDRIIWEPNTESEYFSIPLIDFGGNVHYKIVHHLFIDKSALFLLVVDMQEYSSSSHQESSIFETHIGSWLKLLLTRLSRPRWWLVFTHADKCEQGDITAKVAEVRIDIRCIYEREGLEVEKEPFEIFVTSSEDMTGIVDLQGRLVAFARGEGKVIPPACSELLKELQHPTESQPYLTLEDVRGLFLKIREGPSGHQNPGASLAEEGGDVAYLGESSESSRTTNLEMQGIAAYEPALAGFEDEMSLESILRFAHDIGVILWYRNTPELCQFIFHNPTYLTDLLKAVFTERLPEDLHLDSDFKSEFSERTFEQARDDLLKRGIMKPELLRCLWRHKHLEEDVFSAMIDLFKELDFCYVMWKGDGDPVASFRFPWFLAEEAPKELHQILFGLPNVDCHRITFEYEFRSICPAPMFEKFAVRMHRHCKNKASRKDWKDGFHAKVKDICVVVQKLHRGLETVIRLTVEGEDVVTLWKVLTTLKDAMRDVMKEWPGLRHGGKGGFRYDTYLVCPHCVHQGVQKPYVFPGKDGEEECPEDEAWMTCERGEQETKVPACLVFNVKGETACHACAIHVGDKTSRYVP